ncbi:hypothetical protein PR003_g31498 [Phytophthora rubi]|uniref:Uncharacterized protein n=1 Tax=Phytophthora rubi TaxID=129364 RepID=A0A6A4B8M4_9STRA|nr:hypothetical protein PR003_g31498 [Phytophthora rubi]
MQSKAQFSSITKKSSLVEKPSKAYATDTARRGARWGLPSANFTMISPGPSRTRTCDGRRARQSSRMKLFVAPESSNARSERSAPATWRLMRISLESPFVVVALKCA